MALFYCSKCGNKVSDKAPACPKCGSVNTMYSGQQPTLTIDGSSNETFVAEANPEKKKKIVKTIIAALFVVLFLTASVTVGIIIIGKNTDVKNIEFSSWDYYAGDTDSDGYFVGTVKADNKNPFIAIITKKDTSTDKNDTDSSTETDKDRPDYETITYQPEDYVYVQNGEGSFKLYGDDEPNDYSIDTYLVGMPMTEKDFTSIQYDYTDYRDNDTTTTAFFDVKLSMKKSQSGLLFCRFHNSLTNVDSTTIEAPVVNGEVMIDRFSANRYGMDVLGLFDSINELLGGNMGYSTSNDVDTLPYKSRDTKAIVIQDMYFVPMTNLNDGEISADKQYFKREGGSHSCSWECETTINNPVDGFLVFSATLTEGGKKEDLNKEQFYSAPLSNGKSHIFLADLFDDDKFDNPSYTYLFYGYVGVSKIGDN